MKGGAFALLFLTGFVALSPSNGYGRNPCFATLSGSLGLEVPALRVLGNWYDCRFDLRSMGPGGQAGVWLLLESVNTAPTRECSNPSRIFGKQGQFVLRLPVVLYGAQSYWAQFVYSPSSDGMIWFQLTGGDLLAHRVFVTSVTGDGNLGGWPQAGGASGLAAGDAICQSMAQQAGLPGTFAAWLSDLVDDAYCRVHGLTGKKANNCGQTTLPVAAGPWVRTDGFPFSPAIGDLLDKVQVYVPMTTDESGQPGHRQYWTGTQADGTVYDRDGAPCAGWTSNADLSVAGSTSSFASSLWTIGASNNCAGDYAGLLCMQTGTGRPLPDFTLPGKQVFLTSVTGTGNLGSWPDANSQNGMAAGDEICRSRATAAGLANAQRYKAWLSDGAVDAISRFVSDGPWVRLDGVLVAENRADLSDGELNTAINLTETGVYMGGFVYVWTGTNHIGEKAEDHCNNWMDASEGFSAAGGRAFDAQGWTYASQPLCAWEQYLYCFED